MPNSWLSVIVFRKNWKIDVEEGGSGSLNFSSSHTNLETRVILKVVKCLVNFLT